MDKQRIFVHCVSPVYRRQFNLCVARALDLKEEGHDVALTYCDESSGTCSANLAGNPLTCASCKHSTVQAINGVGLTAIPIHAEAKHEPDLQPTNLEAKKVLATAVNSNLVTQLRMLPSEIKRTSVCRAIKRRYYRSVTRLHQDYRKLLWKLKPNRIEVLNGRHGCSKFPLLAANEFEIPFNALEYTLRKLPIVFKGHLPHDRIAFQNRLKTLPADLAIGEKYYSGRRNATFNKFAKQHLIFEPDPRASKFQSKVTFFLSSQDECASLGPEWKTIFSNDAEVVRQACERFPDKFFCVRFHPHQAGMPGDVAEPYRSFEHYPNLKIYLPDSKINTYELVSWSDCVVTFASTVAIEACWMEKPAIQLGPSFYDQLDISYTPSTVEEFFDLLRQDHLKPGNRENAARFAYFELEDFDEIRHLEINGRRNRVRGMKPRLRIGTALSKRANNLTREAIKTYRRFASKST
jgi:hypothetical protein